MEYYLVLGTENTSCGNIFKEITRVTEINKNENILEYNILYTTDNLLDQLYTYNKVVFIYRENCTLSVLSNIYYEEYLKSSDKELAVQNVKQHLLDDKFSSFNELLQTSIELNKKAKEFIEKSPNQILILSSESMRGEGYSDIIKQIVKFFTGNDISYTGNYSKLIQDKKQLEELETFVKENNV